MATRIEKSRTPKKVIGYATDTAGDITWQSGRIPRTDERGFPASGGVPTNIVDLTVAE